MFEWFHVGMTNPTLPDPGAALAPELLALVHVGGERRPAKVVDHPAFRAARDRLAARGPFTTARVPVVLLNRPAMPAGCRRSSGHSLPEAA